jgi:hypothetical protein
LSMLLPAAAWMISMRTIWRADGEPPKPVSH